MVKIINRDRLQAYCRTCLIELGKNKYNIKKLPKGVLEIFQLICVPTKIEQNVCPKCICKSCCDKIKSFDEFRIMCKESTALLEYELGGMNAKKLNEPRSNDLFQQTEQTERIINKEIFEEADQACEVSPNKNIFLQSEVKEESYNFEANTITNDLSQKLNEPKSNDLFEQSEQTERISKEPQACESNFENIFLQIELKEENNGFEANSLTTDTLSLTSSKEADIKIETNSDNQDTTCEICNLTYSTVELLKMHTLVHKSNKKSRFKKLNTEEHANSPIANDSKFEQFYENSSKNYNSDQSTEENFDLHFISKTTCKICHKTYSSPSALKFHMQQHEENYSFQCEKCERGFNHKYQLKEHIQEIHAEKASEIVCKFGCGASFLRFQTAAAHYIKKHSENIKVDEEDNTKSLSLPTEDESKQSTRTKSSNIPSPLNKLTCKFCFQNYNSTSSLRVHMRLHQDKLPLKCNQCDKRFNHRWRLKLHIKEVHANKPIEIPCKFGCEKIFRRQETANMHYYYKHKLPEKGIKPNENSYVCEDCGRLFKYMASLRKHRFKHRPVEDLPFKCEQCGKRFITKGSYEDHLLRHTGVKNYVCPHCDIKIATKTELRRHVNNHTNKKTYSCERCAKVFNRLEYLRRHTRFVHENIRPYKCTICEQAFAKPADLKHHIMRHTGEKPHECEICNRKFIQAIALKTHMKKHAN